MGTGLVLVAGAVSSQSYALMFPGLLAWGFSPSFLFSPPRRAVMSAVPPHQQGQAGGISMSAQLLGGTIGMAVCSTLFSMTNDFQVVFLSNAVLTLVVFIIGLIAIERRSAAR